MSDIQSKIINLIAEIFSEPAENIRQDMGPGDLARWDSLGQIQLITSLEAAFSTKLTVDQIISINSVADIFQIFEPGTEADQATASAPEVAQAAPSTPTPEPVAAQTYTNDATAQTTTLPTPSNWTTLRAPSVQHTGPGAIEAVRQLQGQRIGLITGASSESVATSVQTLLPANAYSVILERPKGEPTMAGIEDAAMAFGAHQLDTIIAIGGGSTLDFAKLAWAKYELPHLNADALASVFALPKLGAKARLIAIPTLFGSGSEASSAATFTKTGESKKSISVTHDYLPSEVILDPNLALGASKTQLMAGIFDGLTHAIEGAVSVVQNESAKAYAAPAVTALIAAAKQLLTQAPTAETLQVVSQGTFKASIVQNHCSVGLAHAIAHQLPQLLPHAVATGLFLAPVMRSNLVKQDVYSSLATACGYASSDAMIADIEALYQQSQLAPDSAVLNQVLAAKSSIAESAVRDITFKTNPCPHTTAEIASVIESVAKYQQVSHA